MKKVEIIGAGVAGLVLGCYLQGSGYETHITEQHSIAGGLCTSWKRGEYTFDGCLHWLLGSSPGSAFHIIWDELLNLSEMRFINQETRVCIEVKDSVDCYGNNQFSLYSDVDRLESYMIDLSKKDEKQIRKFTNSIRTIQKYQLPPLVEKSPALRTVSEKMSLLRYLPFLLFMHKWSRISNKEFAKTFTDPFLKEAFELLFEGEEYSLLIITMQLAYFDIGSAGYPLGGSLAFVKKLEERYLALGGSISFNSRVHNIMVKDDKAIGVETEKEGFLGADWVVSTADWRYTVFDALGAMYVDEHILALGQEEILRVFPSAILVSLGIGRLFPDVPHLLRFPLPDEMVLADGSVIDRMETHIYGYDESLSPEGKSVLSVTIQVSDADYWINLRERDKKMYRDIKMSIAETVIDHLEQKFGNVREKIEEIDVATPATFRRYTGTWKGSIQGWMPGENLFGASPVKESLPGLDNFYMAGQWMTPGGGVPPSALSARNVAQQICHKDTRAFYCQAEATKKVNSR